MKIKISVNIPEWLAYCKIYSSCMTGYTDNTLTTEMCLPYLSLTVTRHVHLIYKRYAGKRVFQVQTLQTTLIVITIL